MASLMIGGQLREIRFTAVDVDMAERMIIKHGGRAITDVLGNHGALFAKHELEWLLWGAWRHKLPTDRLQTLVAQFYAEGGTIYDLQSEIVEALIDSGLYGQRRALDEETTATATRAVDPSAAGTSA